MLRFLFLFLLIVHGLIHLMGLSKAFGLADLPQLKHEVSPERGFFWGLAGLLFIISTGLFYFKLDTWWMIAIISVCISQYLIIQHWHDTKYGTIINFVILIIAITGIGRWRTEHRAQNAVFRLIPEKVDSINTTPIKTLPPLIRRWLTNTGVSDSDTIQTLYLKQSGEMKTNIDGSWLSYEAEQWFDIKPTGYVWKAHVGNGLKQFDGLDIYLNGKGSTRINAYSIIPVINDKGKETDQSSMVRYLTEMIWFPVAAINESIHWETINDTEVRATMEYKGKQASAIFRFNERGFPEEIRAKRYYNNRNGSTLEDWQVAIDPTSLQEFEGLRVPTRASVTWQLNEGDFTWLRLSVTGLDYNVKLPDRNKIPATKKGK